MEHSNDSNFKKRDDLFSKTLKAGKRTYFFDVKSMRSNESFLTITESKKRFNDDGQVTFEKHKIFLYKEDFANFLDCLNEAHQVVINTNSTTTQNDQSSDDVTFDSL